MHSTPARLDPWLAAAGAWSVPWLVSTIAIGLLEHPLAERGQLLGFNLAEHCALAFLSYLGVKLWARWGSGTWRRALLAMLCFGNALGWAVLPDDVRNFSERHTDQLSPWITMVILITLIGSSLALTWGVANRLGRSTALAVGLGLSGALLAVGNQLVLPGDYRGIHLFLSLHSVCLVAVSLSTLPIARAFAAVRAHSKAKQTLIVLGSLLVALILNVSPPSSVQNALLRSENAPLYRLGARTRALFYASSAGAGVRYSEWFSPRPKGNVAPVPAGPAFFPAPLVILITVDALRADVVSGDHDETLPTFARIRNESVWFSKARAPGALTKVSVSSVFMGKYFSQQIWLPTGKGLFGVKYDPSTRFPELLTAADVRTVNYNAISWLRNGVGCVRGFSEEHRVRAKGHRYTPAKPVFDAMLKMLRRAKPGPIFIHTHLSDPHAPYDLGGKKGSAFDRYLAEVRGVDTQLKRLLDLLDKKKMSKRTILIVQADHGEAFGEHGSRTHGTTLYDEALHVPLMFRIPGVAAKRIDEPVTTLDLGPTILEIFGEPIPNAYMGQSLVGQLEGKPRPLTRPILAENRLQRALVLQSGLKVVFDTRTKTAELYDLTKDPKELHDISDNAALLAEPLATLQAFFEVHAYTQGGYQPPFIR